MPKRMLIDASHPEETRVVVLDGNKVEEFDFEAASKRPLKGNIYLAKVTRVEPSLQAAFVEYGGNRQGFLAFSEIHPDYYQIPIADRQALIAEQEAEARRRQEDEIESFEITSGPKPPIPDDEEEEAAEASAEAAEQSPDATVDAAPEPSALPTEDGLEAAPPVETEANGNGAADDHEDVFVHQGAADDDDLGAHAEEEPPHDLHEHVHHGEDDEEIDEVAEEEAEEGIADEQTVAAAASHIPAEDGVRVDTPEPDITENIPDIQTASEQTEGEQPAGEAPAQTLQAPRPSQRWVRRRHYKIQEVIKRRQIILVQVVKEERGNKGAALTTYLSLAGRYCVLMPNTPRGGGISRKITNVNDRKRLKSAAQALELPEGMGLIIRTAGENRTKVEIKRDYEYLLRMWDTIRETTLNSIAPAKVYEEGDLIKRAIRDLYNKDVGEIVVEGEAGYRNAKDFMRMLMPSHAKNVKLYQEPIPLYQRHHVEAQLDAMFQSTVTLKSGGYLVINQTEALVSIDVNSGRSTREHSIEETARKTNLEAAEEIGRQLRLRDLAGLIVIDFIDMEDSRNDRDVEKRLRDAVKNDRARIQIGKISQFGLLEMSRQRLRAGVIAGSTVPCPHCGGQGIVRSVESTSLRVLRGLEEEAQKQRADGLTVKVASDVAIYTLNQKRRELSRLETEYSITINFEPKAELMAGAFEIERIGHRNPEDFPRPQLAPPAEPVLEEEENLDLIEEEELEEEDEAIEAAEAAASEEERPRESFERADGEGRRRRRRRGGRNRNRRREGGGQRDGRAHDFPQAAPAPIAEGEGGDLEAVGPEDMVEGGEEFATEREGQPPQPGEGGRRRRRRRRGRRGGNRERFGQQGEQQPVEEPSSDVTAPALPAPQPPAAFTADRFGGDRFGAVDEIDTTPPDAPAAPANVSSSPSWSLDDANEIDTTPKEEAKPAEPGAPTKKGWWQRAFKS